MADHQPGCEYVPMQRPCSCTPAPSADDLVREGRKHEEAFDNPASTVEYGRASNWIRTNLGTLLDRLEVAEKRPLRTFDHVGGDRLADEVAVLVHRKVISSRSPAADSLLDYREPPSTPRAERLAELEAAFERVIKERDEARAECERLRAECNDSADRDTELYRLRAAQAADKSRVRSVVLTACTQAFDNFGRVGSDVAGTIANWVAERLGGERSLPARKEWDAEAADRGDDPMGSGYVDGWNDAIDAAERLCVPARCDECDPSFTCFDGSAKCRKKK